LGFRYFGDLHQDEIAARLGVSQTHASRLIASGLAKLQDDFGEELRCVDGKKGLNSWHGDSRSRRRGAAGRSRRQAAAAFGKK
jgi:hypothetical protein